VSFAIRPQYEGGGPLARAAGHRVVTFSGKAVEEPLSDAAPFDQQSGRLAVTRAMGKDINSQREGIQSDSFAIGREQEIGQIQVQGWRIAASLHFNPAWRDRPRTTALPQCAGVVRSPLRPRGRGIKRLRPYGTTSLPYGDGCTATN
jgi:hypothetical protein